MGVWGCRYRKKDGGYHWFEILCGGALVQNNNGAFKAVSSELNIYIYIYIYICIYIYIRRKGGDHHGFEFLDGELARQVRVVPGSKGSESRVFGPVTRTPKPDGRC